MDFTVKVSKVGGSQLGVYLPKWQCENLDIRHGDNLTFVSDKSGGFLVRVGRQTRPKAIHELLSDVENIASEAASDYYRGVGFTPLMSEEEVSHAIAVNFDQGLEALCRTLVRRGCDANLSHLQECASRICKGCLLEIEAAGLHDALIPRVRQMVSSAVGRDCPI